MNRDKRTMQPKGSAEMKILVQVFVCLFVISASSCKKNERKEEIGKLVIEWTGKEIKFPENLPCYVSGLETSPESCDDSFHKEFKILLYVMQQLSLEILRMEAISRRSQ